MATDTGNKPTPDISLLDWAGDGLGLNGPGAPGVIRAAFINAATSQVPVVITTSTVETISLDPAARPAWLTIVLDEEAALDLAEERIEDPVYDLNAGHADLSSLLLITDIPRGHDQRFTGVLKHDLIGALFLESWESAGLIPAADGAVTRALRDDPTRCLLEVMGSNKKAEGPQPRPAPRP